MNTANANNEINTETVKLSTQELRAQYAVTVEEQKEAHAAAKELDPTLGKFKVAQTWAEYKTAYNIAWDLEHPNEKDALVPETTTSTDVVLQVVTGAIDAAGTALVAIDNLATLSKAGMCRAIFDAELAEKGVAGLVRKDIINRFKAEVHISPACANTYYQNIRDKKGLVNHKA